MSIVVVGSVVLDSIRSPHGSSNDALGGSAIYFAGAAAAYTSVKLVGVVGHDFPEEGNRFLAERGIDTEGLTTLPGRTFRYEAEYGKNLNDRKTISTCLNVFEQFHPELPESYRQAEVVFLGNIDPALQLEVLDQVRNPSLVAADTMNYWIEGARPDLEKMLKRIDTLMINDSEVLELTGETNLIAAAHATLDMGPTCVVIKKGEHGALLNREGEIFVTPAYPVEVVKDPTGAGDAFAGGFLGHLARTGTFDRKSYREAMLHGTAVASFVVEEFGPAPLSGLTTADTEKRYSQLVNMSTI